MGGKIIVIDDSQTMRQQIGAVLQSAGYTMIEAEDGLVGLDAVKAHPDAALILCDINMPRMNGLEFLAALRELKEYEHLPILVLTTEGHPKFIEQARKCGAKGWLIKPLKADLLLSAVRKISTAPRR